MEKILIKGCIKMKNHSAISSYTGFSAKPNNIYIYVPKKGAKIVNYKKKNHEKLNVLELTLLNKYRDVANT